MTLLLCDSGWYVHKSDVQNIWDDNTHTLASYSGTWRRTWLVVQGMTITSNGGQGTAQIARKERLINVEWNLALYPNTRVQRASC